MRRYLAAPPVARQKLSHGNSARRRDINTLMGRFNEDGDSAVIKASLAHPEVFGVLVDRYGDRLLRYLRRRVGPSIGDDLASEVFLVAFESRHRYRPRTPTALPWLYGIATNLLRNHSRSEQSRCQALGRLAGQRELDEQAGRIDDALTAAALVHRLAAVFAQLPGDSRDVLFLVGVEGMSYEDAAVALSVPVGTVRSRLARAREELKKAMPMQDGAPCMAAELRPRRRFRG